MQKYVAIYIHRHYFIAQNWVIVFKSLLSLSYRYLWQKVNVEQAIILEVSLHGNFVVCQKNW